MFFARGFTGVEGGERFWSSSGAILRGGIAVVYSWGDL